MVRWYLEFYISLLVAKPFSQWKTVRTDRSLYKISRIHHIRNKYINMAEVNVEFMCFGVCIKGIQMITSID